MKKIILFLLITVNLFAQSFSGGFNFYLPSSDTSSQKFLPQFPKAAITNDHFVTIDANGKFSLNGKRIRFWGTNCGAGAAFPEKTLSENIAGRLRKFGFNLIRFHHMDNPGWGKSLLGTTSTRSLNPSVLDQLEFYLSKLKENDIYANINLHVSRTFRTADGVAEADSIPEMGKITNFIDPYMMMLHKEYAQQLLTHVNPYTGKALVEDPVMAMVEITNENSIVRGFRDNQLKPIKNGGTLPYRYSRMLDSLWNDFLETKYHSTTNLRTAWNQGIILAGRGEQIVNGGFEQPDRKNYWALEQHNGAVADTSRDNTTAHTGSSSFKINVTNSTGTTWYIQFKQPTLVFQKDSSYTVSFAVKSDARHSFDASLMNDASPYNGYGGKTFQSSTGWQVFNFSVKSSELNNGHGRLTFQLGGELATYWFDDISVTSSGVSGLVDDETIEAKNIRRIDYTDCPGYSDQRVKDITEFYVELQRNYFKEMIRYLKNDLGVKVPIITSNWMIGPIEVAALSDGDIVDNHAYWDHPQFPNIPWSSTDWLINNTPMVKDADGGTIPSLMVSIPSVNKPFIISEYDHPTPNIYQVESILFTTGYASFYDADALMYFAYNEAEEYSIDKITGFFSINHNPIFMGFFPTAAFAFRNGFVRPSLNPILLDYSTDLLYGMPKYNPGDWRGPNIFKTKNGLINAIKTRNYFTASSSDFSNLQTLPVSPYKTDTDEITWNSDDGTIILEGTKISAAAGFLAKLKNTIVGSFSITDFNTNDFGAITWISLTDEKLSKSTRSLITLGSKSQNTNMIWDGISTIHDKWGNSPTQVYPLSINLDLNIEADSIKIYPLDWYGREEIFPPYIIKPASLHHFNVELNQIKTKTLWFGIEKFGVGDPTGVENNDNLPTEFRLEQNYPNPFNPSTTITYTIPGGVETLHATSLRIFDVLGREVATLVNENKPAVSYSVTFNAKTLHGASLPSGIYFYQLRAGDYLETKKMLLMK